MSTRLKYAIIVGILTPIVVAIPGTILFGLNQLYQYLNATGHDFLAFVELIVFIMALFTGFAYLFYDPNYQR